MLTLRHSQVLVDCPNADQRAHYEALAIQLRIDVGFEMSRNGRFRLAAVDCPELPTPEGRRARDFVYKCLLRAKTIVVKTQRTDLHGRYVTQLFYSADEVDIPTRFAQGTHLLVHCKPRAVTNGANVSPMAFWHRRQ